MNFCKMLYIPLSKRLRLHPAHPGFNTPWFTDHPPHFLGCSVDFIQEQCHNHNNLFSLANLYYCVTKYLGPCDIPDMAVRSQGSCVSFICIWWLPCGKPSFTCVARSCWLVIYQATRATLTSLEPLIMIRFIILAGTSPESTRSQGSRRANCRYSEGRRQSLEWTGLDWTGGLTSG